MHAFKLWNKDKTTSYALDGSVLVTNIKGLGIKFDAVKTNEIITKVNAAFENITMTLNFGVNSNPYTTFHNFMIFIRNNGKNNFILEYSVNGSTIFADVWFNKITKSEKTSFNILEETLELGRVSYWYEIKEETIPATGFLELNNPIDEDLQSIITINGATTGIINLSHQDEDLNAIGSIALHQDLIAGERLVLNGYEKKVIHIDGVDQENGYYIINKAQDTFIVIQPGINKLSITQGTAQSITIEYKQWVID